MDMFELRNRRVGEKEMFDMKTQPWFIKINSQEEFDLVQEWLVDNFGRNLRCKWETDMTGITNTSSLGEISSGMLMWTGHGDSAPHHNSLEIKFPKGY